MLSIECPIQDVTVCKYLAYWKILKPFKILNCEFPILDVLNIKLTSGFGPPWTQCSKYFKICKRKIIETIQKY